MTFQLGVGQPFCDTNKPLTKCQNNGWQGFNCICITEGGRLQLLPDGTCADVDECMVQNGGCQQVCQNSIGSYKCACLDGYFLKADSTSCESMSCPAKVTN